MEVPKSRRFGTHQALSQITRRGLAACLAACLLLAAAALQAQPQLKIVHGREQLASLPGLTGVQPHSGDPRALTVWAWDATYTLLAFNVEVINVGDQAWDPNTVPGSVYRDAWGWKVRGFFNFSLTDNQGNIVEAIQDAQLYGWDYPLASPAGPPQFNARRPGLSPGYAALAAHPLFSGTWINIAGLPNGDYTLSVAVDPLNQWGQFAQEQIRIRLEYYQVTLLPD